MPSWRSRDLHITRPFVGKEKALLLTEWSRREFDGKSIWRALERWAAPLQSAVCFDVFLLNTPWEKGLTVGGQSSHVPAVKPLQNKITDEKSLKWRCRIIPKHRLVSFSKVFSKYDICCFHWINTLFFSLVEIKIPTKVKTTEPLPMTPNPRLLGTLNSFVIPLPVITVKLFFYYPWLNVFHELFSCSLIKITQGRYSSVPMNV